MSRKRLSPAAWTFLALVGLPAPVAAQAVLAGRIVNDSTRQPISGVEVVLEKPAVRVESDGEGRFSLGGIPWGIQTAVIRKIGYRPVHLRLMVASDDTVQINVRLKAAAVELEPIEVTVSSVPPGMEAFARRRIAGFGRFFDSKALRRAENRRVSDLLTGVAGVRVVNRGFRSILVSSRSNCAMAIWLDGVQLSGPGRRTTQDINEIPISQLEGIEVYSGASDMPAELMGVGGGSCGAVVLWTRRGR